MPRRFVFCLLFLLALATPALAEGPTVWSPLPEAELAPVLSAYARETGQTPVLVRVPAGELAARYLATRSADKPDLILGLDVTQTAPLAEAGLLAALDATVIPTDPPEMWRAPQNRWLVLAYRPLGLVYAVARVNPDSLSNYEALAQAPWKGRLSLPSGRDPALLTLAGFLKARYGATDAAKLLGGYVTNLALPATGDSAEAVAAVAAGKADVALADAGALARHLIAHPATRLAVFWPNQHTDGMLATTLCAGLAAGAPKAAAGQKLLAWLAAPAGQKALAAATLSYPLAEGVRPAPLLVSFGEFRLNLAPVEIYARLLPEATTLLRACGLDR